MTADFTQVKDAGRFFLSGLAIGILLGIILKGLLFVLIVLLLVVAVTKLATR